MDYFVLVNRKVGSIYKVAAKSPEEAVEKVENDEGEFWYDEDYAEVMPIDVEDVTEADPAIMQQEYQDRFFREDLRKPQIAIVSIKDLNEEKK